ncbi:hypothetical protein C9374_012885 [Naegleria lovaniensis]|uniref:N-acetyltransferase domain-containing protein n=1 Tax=Naegleria lovaniensis TaxID=51637 RepID=A0AA88KDL3_NAELO|nr:uncharacterized protein C9374_012885 [Naegleria lovaniensis]KAG2373039.1 hypothetical protein C9374_012885 [Naegleria lovaniensis]
MSADSVRVSLVTTTEAFQQVMTVRREVFVEEQQIDSSLEFDANDTKFSEQLNSSSYQDDIQTNFMRYYLAELVHQTEAPSESSSSTSIQTKVGGTCRARKTGENSWKIERFAVLKNLRGFGMGRKLLRFVLLDLGVKQQDKPKIYLHAQLSAVPFYQKCIFEEEGLKGRFLIVGDQFEEASIPHCKMEWQWE